MTSRPGWRIRTLAAAVARSAEDAALAIEGWPVAIDSAAAAAKRLAKKMNEEPTRSVLPEEAQMIKISRTTHKEETVPAYVEYTGTNEAGLSATLSWEPTDKRTIPAEVVELLEDALS